MFDESAIHKAFGVSQERMEGDFHFQNVCGWLSHTLYEHGICISPKPRRSDEAGVSSLFYRLREVS